MKVCYIVWTWLLFLSPLPYENIVFQLLGACYIALLAIFTWWLYWCNPTLACNDAWSWQSLGFCVLSSVFGLLCSEITCAPQWYFQLKRTILCFLWFMCVYAFCVMLVCVYIFFLKWLWCPTHSYKSRVNGIYTFILPLFLSVSPICLFHGFQCTHFSIIIVHYVS